MLILKWDDKVPCGQVMWDMHGPSIHVPICIRRSKPNGVHHCYNISGRWSLRPWIKNPRLCGCWSRERCGLPLFCWSGCESPSRPPEPPDFLLECIIREGRVQSWRCSSHHRWTYGNLFLKNKHRVCLIKQRRGGLFFLRSVPMLMYASVSPALLPTKEQDKPQDPHS